MRRLVIIIGICLSPSLASATIGPATQAIFNNACGAVTSCTVNAGNGLAALGAGHLLVVQAHSGNTVQLTSVTATGETFTVISIAGGNGVHCPFNGGGNTTQFGCAYVLKSVGGATSVTCNFSGTTGASNTTCGVTEVPFTAPRMFLENNSINGSRTSGTTFTGGNFANSFTTFINGTNDIIFQSVNVSTGTVSAIGSSFVLSNNTGQVADAYKLNTFDNTAPTWTNSVAATSIVMALSFGEDYNSNTPAIVPAATLNNSLQLSYSGSVGTRLVTVIAPGQFELIFDEGDNWGIAYWYDLVNDPGTTTNLLGPAYVPGPGHDISLAEPGLFNRTYYDNFPPSDAKQFDRASFYYFPNSPRQLSILEYNSSRIIIQTKGEPAVTATGVVNNLIGTTQYTIYPNGRIYVHYVATLTNAFNFVSNIFSDVTLEDPTQLGTNPPDSQGWIRASATQNPYTSVAGAESYLFAYWSPSTPAPYTGYTKASVLLVRNPANLHDNGQVIHSWASGTGFGVVRWGWSSAAENFNIGAGGTLTEDMLIQLGTQGSTVLPNITTSTVAGPIAAFYIANPSPPAANNQIDTAVNQSATMQFSSTDTGTWACTGTDNSGAGAACHGSINVGSGLYTAPASVTAQQSLGGSQLLPNNHIFNTDISGLSVNTNNAAWMAAVNIGGSPNFTTDFPFNYLTPSSATDNMVFHYTPANNGVFEVPSFPTGLAESGWFGARNSINADHHVLGIDTTTGILSDFYQYYCSLATTAAAVSGNVATLTFASDPGFCGFRVGGVVQIGSFTGADTYFNTNSKTISTVTSSTITYPLTHANGSATSNGSVTYNTNSNACDIAGTCNSQSGLKYTNSSYSLPPISTDAAGMEIQPLVLKLQELEQALATSGTINHAFRNTFGIGTLASSKIWPATTFATDGGTVPFGARLRLKSTFDISPYSATAKILLTTLKNYGTIVCDGGNNWPMNGESTRWPKSYYDALTEISGIGATLANNMEFVDESPLMISATSGLTTRNREIVTFTRTSDSATASVDVALQGVAVNLSQNYLYIQASTPAQQLTALVNIGAVTWTMSPTVGTLTSGGLYTAPATVGSATTTTITATSTTNAAVAAQMAVTQLHGHSRAYLECPYRPRPA